MTKVGDIFKKEIHMMTLKELEAKFQVDVNKGLSSSRAKESLAKIEKQQNKISYKSIFKKIALGLVDYFSIILWFNLVVFILLYKPLGQAANITNFVSIGILIFVIVLKSYLIGLQEYRAIRLLKRLQTKNVSLVSVLRDGEWSKIPAWELVVGDVVEININERVPVDIVLVTIKNLRLDKSIFTGESTPVEAMLNNLENMESKSSMLDAKNMAFKNFLVVNGFGKGIVVSLGNKRFLSDVDKSVEKQRKSNNHISKGLTHLSIIITFFTILTGVVYLFVWAIFTRGFLNLSTTELFYNVLSSDVTGIPICIPLALTSGLFIVFKRLKHMNILVKNIFSIHTMSEIDVVLTDKTGTLTQNAIQVANVCYSTQEIDIEYCYQSSDVYLGAQNGINDLLDLCDFCAPDEPMSNTMDTVLFEFSRTNRPDSRKLNQEYEVVNEIQFSSTNKYSFKIIKSLDQQCVLIVRGAPDFLLPKCRYLLDPDGSRVNEMREQDVQTIEDKMNEWSSKGRRLISFCKCTVKNDTFKSMDTQQLIDWFDNKCTSLYFVGMIGFIDPPKPCIKESVSRIRELNIRMIMITGDYSVTAASIANQVGMLSDLKYDTYSKLRENMANKKALKKAIILNGQEIGKLSKEEWKTVCCEYNEIILSRSSPKHKLICVREFQSNGYSVLVIGDGVNDVPALKQADLSVAMNSGSKLATDISNVVLLDNTFLSAVELLIIGRQTFYNIKKIIIFSFISSIFSQNIASLVNGIFGIPQLYSGFQMTIVSAFTDLFPSISLFYEKPEHKVMIKRSSENLIDKRILIMAFLFFGPITTFFTFLNYFLYFKFYAGLNPSDLVYKYFSDNNQSSQLLLTAQTVAFYSIVVLQAFGNLYSIRTRRLLFSKSLPFAHAHRNLPLIAASLFSYAFATVCVSVSIPYFTSAIPPVFYALPVAFSLVIILVDEMRKYYLPRSAFIQRYLSW